MFLTDIIPGTKLTIVLKHEVGTMEFTTTVARSINGGLLANPIMENGRLINFAPKPNILYQMNFVNNEDHRLYKWNRVDIYTVKDEQGQPYHMLVSDIEGHPHNRRRCYRISLDIDGSVRIGQNSITLPIAIRNISSGGVGFECKQNINCPEGTMMHLTFSDSVLHINFKLDCQLVRMHYDEDHECFYYGCKFPKESSAINNYVQRKQQRLRIKNNPNYRR